MLHSKTDTENLGVLVQLIEELLALLLRNLACSPIFQHVLNFINFFS